ncbi:MAG: DUF4843 domain-containing protein [Bacteroidales bacterium]|nr:DUF4843 domain-containing protein [Bacteroidales bacterium]
MKRFYTIMLTVALMAVAIGCAEKYPLYDEPQDKLYFDYGKQGADSVLIYSFLREQGTETTVYVPVKLLGFLSDSDRRIAFEQIMTGEDDAVAGTHYVAFTDEAAASKMILPANQVEAKVPITLKRDASLKDKRVNLRFTIKDNGEFGLGLYSNLVFTVQFSDKLEKPANWNYFAEYYLTTWSETKHKFIEEALNCVVDDAWLKKLGADASAPSGYDPSYDYGYVSFIVTKLDNLLAALNEERAAQGLGPLEDEYGPVEFGF